MFDVVRKNTGLIWKDLSQIHDSSTYYDLLEADREGNSPIYFPNCNVYVFWVYIFLLIGLKNVNIRPTS